MPSADAAEPVSPAEARTLFASLADASVVVIAVSGGPDSTALLALVARWRAARKRGPKLVAVTIDHGLRPESAREAQAVKRQAAALGVPHRTVRWQGPKPSTGIQAAAREARYRLLAAAARRAKARHILTAHTLDDQAETVLFRMARGSGLSGLRAMAHDADRDGISLTRPLLGVTKARLIATLEAMEIPFSDDPSNRDPRFTRPRLRSLMPALAEEGLTARRLAVLAVRMRRADATIEGAVDTAWGALVVGSAGASRLELDAAAFTELPDEVALRLLGRAIARVGNEGPAELGKLETLFEALKAASARSGSVRRTLAGALVTLRKQALIVERAPRRRLPKTTKSP